MCFGDGCTKVQGEIVYTHKKMTQLCRCCDKLVEADQTNGWRNNMHVSDRSVCSECGHVLWNWAFRTDLPIAKPSVPKPPKGQIKLF